MPTVESHYGAYIIRGRAWGGREGTLVQTDWDYPATAERLGWSLRRVQRPQAERYVRITPDGRRYRTAKRCDHASTDGTVDCRECGVTASEFIAAAGEFLSRRAE